MAMHHEIWFPSVIWSAIIHCVDNTKLKDYAYHLKETTKGRHISNEGGFQSDNLNINENQEINSLVKHVNDEVFNCSQQVGLPICKIQNLWININPPHSYNTLHNHLGALFSGIYYVDAKENQGKLYFERNDTAEYFLPPIENQVTYYNSSRAAYQPKTNALFIFPGWLKHNVTANQTKDDRISISFNYGI